MTSIARVDLLPGSAYNGTGIVGIAITSGVPCFYKVTGSNLSGISSVNWYPEDPNSVQFATRQMILIDETTGTFMLMVTNNYLYDNNRGGHLSFRLIDSTTLTFPVETFGRVSITPLWTAPDQGLITG